MPQKKYIATNNYVLVTTDRFYIKQHHKIKV